MHIFTRLSAAVILMFTSVCLSAQVNITPIRTDVSGFATWTDATVAGTTYLQLLASSSSTISPAMNFDSYSGEALNFKARTFGGTSGSSAVITVSISTDNGGTWTTLGTRTPGSSSLVAMTAFDVSAYNGTQVKIRFQSLGGTGTIGVGIDDITITGTALCTAPSTQASAITFPTVGSTTLNLNWTNGNGAGRVVKMNTSNSFTAPTTGSNPTASLAYSGSGEQVVYNGTGSGPITITGLSASSTYWFRVYEYCSPDRVYQTATATNNPNSQTTTSGSTSITTTSASYGPFCNGTANAISVAYTPTGSFTGTFYVQLSDASGVFPSNATSNLIGTGSGSSPISASIPSGTTAGTGYRVRVINDNPVTHGSDNGSNISINATPTTPGSSTPAAVCEGGTATITGAGSTGATAYTFWTASSSGNAITTGSTPPGTVASNTLSTPTTLTAGSYIYYVQGENGSCLSAARQAVTVTVNAVPANPTGSISVSANPSCGPATLSYTTGYYWQTSAGGTSTGSPTSSSYSLASTGTIYVRAYNGNCWSSGNINTGSVTINTAPGISVGPSNQTVTTPATATFSVTASGTGISYQWQISTDGGGTWANVSGGTGGTTASYTTAATGTLMDGYKYQCVVSGTAPCTPATSSAATLSVNTGPCLGEDFTAGTLPTSWAQTNVTFGSNYADFSANTGTLTTLAISYPSSLAFDLMRTTNTTAKTLYVKVSTTSPSGGYTTLATYDHSNTTSGGTTAGTVDLSAYNSYSTVYIQFEKSSATTSPWRIDNIAVTCATPCAAPGTQASGISFSGVGSSSMNVNWTNGSGAGRIVKINSSNSFTAPTDGSNPTASTTWANAGEQVIYNGTGSGPVGVSGLSSGTTYWYRVYEYCSPTRTYNTATASNNPNSQTTTSTPEINLKGNSVSIVNGDTSPSTADFTDFGSTETTGGSIVRTFSIENLGTAALHLTGSSPYVAVSGTGAADFSVTTIPTPTITANGSTTFQVTFDPSVTGLRTATLTIANDDSDEGSYSFSIQGTGTNSATSDIIADAAYAYTSNIDYTLYQGSPASSLGNSVGVFKFTIRDGGASASDADALGTELTGITLTVANIANIRSAALFGGASQNSLIDNTPVINTGAGTITFSGLSGTNVTAADNGSKDITLRVSFLSTVTDNQQLQYTVSAATATITGSSFAAGNAGGATSSITGDRNRLEVTATQLAFVQQPGNTAINVDMAPSPTVSANDANGNRDQDFTGSVSITSTGTLTTSPVSVSAAAGLASFASINHTATGTGLTLGATASGLAGTTSSTFNITSIAYVNGDYRTIGSGTWVSNNASPAIWQRLVSGVWTASNSPAYATANNVYIQNGHSITTGGSYGSAVNLKVMDGGTFNNNHSGTAASLYIYGNGTLNINANFTMASGGNFEVEDDGNVNVSFEYGTPTSSIWQGVEIFHPNSNFTFMDWDCANDNLLPDNTSISTNPYNGYTAAFGNIICDFGSNLGASDDWILLNSGTTINLAHGDLIFRTNDFSGADMRLSTTGTVASGIGGDFVVEDTYLGTQVINLKSSGTLTFSIKGNMQLDAATTRLFTGTSVASTVTVEGDLNITPSAILDFNSTASASPVATLNLKGDLTVAGLGTLQNSNTSNLGQLHFAGTGNGLTAATTQTIDIASTGTNENKNIVFTVDNGAYVQLANRDFELGNSSSVVVANGGIFDFGFNGSTALISKEVTAGAGSTAFTVQAGGTIKITSDDAAGAIRSAATLGNIQTDTRTMDVGGIYHYIGKANQITGDGLPNNITGKVIVELGNNTITLTPNASRTITTGELNIKKGTLIETNGGNFFDGAGSLTMSDGLYQIATVNTGATQLPRLSGTYTLTGGTIELNGNTTASTDRQTLRGASRQYYNLKVSGSSSGGGYKEIASAMGVKNQLQITGTAIFDIAGNGMTGNAGISMNSGRLRMSKLNTALPELDGTATPYTLTGGTVEFYGSGSAQSQLIRATYGSSTAIVYADVEVNAAAANTDAYNVSPASTLTVAGTLTVNTPAVFQLDATEAVGGVGNFTLTAGSTLKYASSNGIKTSGTGTGDGNIRISGTRTLPSTASYGFTGSGNMVSGNGLPATVVNLYVQKGAAADQVSLTQSVNLTGTLIMTAGNVVTGANLLEIGISTTQKGTLNYTDGYVIGSLKRWFNGSNSGAASGLFPLGVGSNDRFVTVEYGSAPSAGGALTAQFVGTAMGINGLPLPISAAGSCSAFVCENTSQDGYWQMDNSGLTGGNYDITLVGENLSGITDLCELTALKRVGGSPWMQSGTHTQPSGSVTRPVVKRTAASGWSNWGFGGGSVNPLPVTLTSFTGTCDHNTVTLQWTTASEINSERFIVESSTDLQSYEYVTSLAAAGISNEIRHYQTQIIRPDNVSYFRLRQEDFDGAFEYFGPISVSCTATGNWNVYTHNGMLFVTAQGMEPGTYTFALTDMNGKHLYNQNGATDGTLNITTDISTFAPGVYVVSLQSAHEHKTFKIVLSR